ncbi:alpha/beta hydrolase [Nocardia canadensis]|uniref:alpha/beta hydrolase n=1 Tax=Nocardia canadensis TaxID=3065238 RepID=UPI00292DE633|nr:alpha/beta hydrolase family protein [Nocardia canadensis]
MVGTIRRALASGTAACVLAVCATVLGAGNGRAEGGDPIVESKKLLATPTTADGSHIVSSRIGERDLSMLVFSAAMNKAVTIKVQRPKDASRPRPVLYLLNGAGGGEDRATWWQNTDVGDFLATKDVNVVMPIGGAWAYYTDWQRDDPTLGRNKWRTFLLDELPPLVDQALGTNGVNAIAANSMTATAVLQLAEARPGFYQSVAGYSGCAQIADPIGQQFTKLVVQTYGGGDVRNMYGADDDPAWAANDPVLHAEKLRGTRLFVSDSSGLPGPHDSVDDPYMMNPTPAGLANQLIVGGVIEAAVNWCTRNLETRLGELGIPATFDRQATGTHSWGYWRDAFHRSWPVLAAGLGLPE